MNITFRVGAPDACDILEEKFISEAASLGMIQLKGHRYRITTLSLFQYWHHIMSQFFCHVF